MNSQEKYIIQQKTRQKYNFLRFMTGLKAIIHRRYARIIAAAYAIIVVLVGVYVFSRSNQNADMFEIIHMAIWRLLYPLLVPVTTIFLIIPKDSQGLFINHNKTIFQGFLFDEREVFYDE